MPEQLPPDDVIAERWEKVASALEPVRDAWLAVSPDSAGPVTELLRSARWNACAFHELSRGVPRLDAWHTTDAEHGRGQAGYVNYEPPDDTDDAVH